MAIEAPKISPLNPPPRLMMGPGPSNAHPRVYQAMALPQVGHLDPVFLKYVEDIKSMLRYVWQTKNEFTVPVSGTASAAWEACCANLIEPGDKVLTFVHGYFGERHVDMASRYGGEIIRVDKPFGQNWSLEEIAENVRKHRPQMVYIVHAETSTGVLQSVEGIGEVCRETDSIFLLDTVTSIGGMPIKLDEWKVDACYAGFQKCMGCPPGISALTFGPRAMQKLKARKTKVPNWYLDMNMIAQYLAPEGGASVGRVYHHTAPISMIYALRESLSVLLEEGFESSVKRHRANAELLWKGVEGLGLQLLVPIEYRLPSLCTIKIPEGVDGLAVTKYLLETYNLEVGGGLGSLKGKVWRVGLMGFNSRAENVLTLLAALKDALSKQGWKGSNV